MKAITDLFEESVNKFKDKPYLLEKRNGKYEPTSYIETREQVYRFAAGLMSLGIQKGDRIALLSEGRNNWVIAELGILYVGAVNVPLSIKLNEPSEIKFRLEHSGSRMLIVSRNQSNKILSISNELPELEKIIFFDPKEILGEREIMFESILKLGEHYLTNRKEEFKQRWKSIEPGDYANICYTSGTTADPKGIVLTHRNYTSNTEQSLSIVKTMSTWVTLVILPWDHAFAHSCGIFSMMKAGACIASVEVGNTPMETLKNIPINIKEVKPHFIMSVPALSKNFRKNIETGIRSKGRVTEILFKLALANAYAYNGMGNNMGSGWRILLKPFVALFDKILFSKIRAVFGGEMLFFVGGGAMLDIELQRFFAAIGIPVYQGYGLTEASPVISANSKESVKFGSSGIVAPAIDIKICDEKGHTLPMGEKGEIVIKGENVMNGYWRNPNATAETIKDGWLYTGDMGSLDKDRFLFVFGRFKCLLISDDGEKYSPEGIEEALVGNSPFIDQVMLYNNQNPYTVALIYPNKEALKRYCKEKHLKSEKTEMLQLCLKHIEGEIAEYKQGKKYGNLFPGRWLPTTFAIIPEGFTEDNHFLNSTLKMVRGKITKHYKETLDYLYTPEAKNIANERNMETMRELLITN